jgi:hypothetical protein
MTTKYITISIEIIKKRKLTIKKSSNRLRNDKSRVFALYGTSQCIVTREKNDIYIYIHIIKKTRVSALPDQRECARSYLRCAQTHAGLQGSCGATLNDGARVTVDVDMCSITYACSLAQIRSIALLGNFYSFFLFQPLNRILMLVTCSTLRHQKLIKTLERDTVKSLTNIS